LNLYRWKEEYRDYTQGVTDGYDHKKVIDEMHNELTWLVAKFDQAKEKFKNYLRIK
jgi:hypothetical protein